MWHTSLFIIEVILFCIARFMRKWRNPKCNGVLPPGSMGIPLFGETIQIIIPSYSLDIHPFITKRIRRYGPIFRTNLAGRPMVVSVDREFNNYIIQQEGRSVELWYMDTFSKVFSLEGEFKFNSVGEVHKYLRGILVNQFGFTTMMKLLPDIQTVMLKSMEKWLTQPYVDVKAGTCTMLFEFITIHLLSEYRFEASPEIMSERFSNIFKGLMAFPLNVPGTAFHESLKEHKRLSKILTGFLRERLSSGNLGRPGDILDEILDGMRIKEFMTEVVPIQVLFVSLFTSLETISIAITLLLMLISENDKVVEDLRAEHASITVSGEKGTSSISWEQLKSLEFTNQVIKETLRLANVIPGILRRAVQDVHVKGMTIPAGWTIMLVNSPVHMNPDFYIHPLEFNPWRWKGIDSYTASKNFMPFGGGARQCLGADYTKVIMTMFVHVLVTNLRWTKIKGGKVCRDPVLRFKEDLRVKFSKYDKTGSPNGNIIENAPSDGEKEI